ncbi:MAG: A/G-specific adenine glycosylase [Oscillospiraceae bacterium]|nr:A/G-specific adenine glycosylase [Oscillospiraceae bacterium]
MTDKQIIEQALPRIADWYAAARRPLPWRLSPTPYHVWISEIMLQQTRIEAVIPYYERFISELPDIPSLAKVDENRLLKLWEGLGYYSRARNLRKAAVQVCERHGGKLPASAEELKKLPGVGDYTAGAIASIAFGLAEPAVDGNVLRVLSRLLADGRDVLSPSVRREAAALLRAGYPAGEAAALVTEGLMELGETVCVPGGEARCALCPLKELCRARSEGAVERYPVRSAPRPRRVEERTVLLLRCAGKTAIRRREEKGLLAGLWEFPSLDGFHDADELRALWPDALSVTPCGEARHLFTHVEWRMRGFLIELPRELPIYVWEDARTIRAAYSVPTALKAFLRRL